jgi:glycosyltransferase involved in cell wall biosynthesis
MNVDVCCSVGHKYAGGGQGTTAAGTFGEAVEAGVVKRLFIGSYVCGTVPPDIARCCPYQFVTKTTYRVFKYVPVLRNLPMGLRSLIDDNVFDLWVASRIGAFNGRIDVFHGWHHQCLFSMRAARERGAKLVVDQVIAHPAYIARVLPAESNPYTSLTIRKAEREYELADRILLPSQFVARTFRQKGIDEAKMTLLPYGVDSKRYSPGKAKARSRCSVLFVGSVTRRKGVDTLVEAFSRADVAESSLDIVGPINRDMEPLTRLLLGHPSIRFHGQCDPLPFYRNAAVFALPSLIEGSALVCYEAAACGLPVITTYESGSVIRDGVEGFIIPKDDISALADRIRLLAQDDHLRKTMSRAARERAMRFPWERRGQAVIQLYRELAVKGPGSDRRA